MKPKAERKPIVIWAVKWIGGGLVWNDNKHITFDLKKDAVAFINENDIAEAVPVKLVEAK